jgi:Ca2+-binding EF-hand superfamily protein
VEKVYLKDTGGKVRGSIFVKIYWDDLPVPDKDFTEFTRAWEDELSRRIMGEIKRNKLTLQGAFNLADADNSQDITRDEFSSVLTKVLQIQITPREMNEYWSRVIRGTNKDTVSYSHLLTFYGNLLDASVLGHGGSMKKGIADIKRMFEDGDKGLPGSSSNQSIADQAKIFEQYSLELKRVMKEKNMNEKQLFDTFDSDKNHRINRHEFHICNEDILKVKTSPRDLDLIFDYADKNKTDNVDLAELLKMINFDVKGFIQDKMSTPRSLDPNHMDNWKSDRILHEFLQLVKEYMANNNMSVYQFFAMVDKSKDSYLTKAEMQNFFENVMNLKIPALHMKVILNEIDKSGDNKVSVKEFIAFMHLEESFSLLNDEGKRAELKDLLVAKIFYEYQVKNELTPADLVLKMDADGNGNIDYFELGHFCRNLANNIPSRDIEKFMAFVDQDLSKNISLKELERVLEAYNKIAEEEVDLTPAELEDLLKRILPLIDQNKERLKMMLESHEDKPGEMKLDVFRKSMNKTTLFTPKDVDLIINPLLRQFISYRRIRYTALFDLKKNYSQYAKMKESGLGTYRGSKLVEQIFAAMKKVGIKHKITHYELFQCFDTDDSGFLTLKEMKYIWSNVGETCMI